MSEPDISTPTSRERLTHDEESKVKKQHACTTQLQSTIKTAHSAATWCISQYLSTSAQQTASLTISCAHFFKLQIETMK